MSYINIRFFYSLNTKHNGQNTHWRFTLFIKEFWQVLKWYPYVLIQAFPLAVIRWRESLIDIRVFCGFLKSPLSIYRPTILKTAENVTNCRDMISGPHALCRKSEKYFLLSNRQLFWISEYFLWWSDVMLQGLWSSMEWRECTSTKEKIKIYRHMMIVRIADRIARFRSQSRRKLNVLTSLSKKVDHTHRAVTMG